MATISTRSALDRVLQGVLEEPDNGLLCKALDLSGIKSMDDIIMVLSIISQDPIPTGSRNQLHALKAWYWYLMESFHLRQVNWDDIQTINVDEFDSF